MPNHTQEPPLPQEPPQQVTVPAPAMQNNETSAQPTALPPSLQEESEKTVTVPKLKRLRQIHVQPLRKTTGDVQIPRETTENPAPPATNNTPDTLEDVEAPEENA